MKDDKNIYTKLVLTTSLVVVTIFYIDFRILKSKFKKYINNINNNINNISNNSPNSSLLKQFLVHNNNITDVLSVKFYVPYYPIDLIQRTLVETGKFFEHDSILAESDKYLNKNSIVLDLGANIGNHTLYWNKITKVKKIYAFEPVDDTYEILERNIELNNIVNNSISINHIGLGDKIGKASVAGKYDLYNIGGTNIKMDDNGDFNVTTLDKFMEENFKEDKIDLIKIDVEGFEYQVLSGAKKTLAKYNPVIIIESFANKFEQVNSLLNSYGYKMIKDLGGSNYVYIKE